MAFHILLQVRIGVNQRSGRVDGARTIKHVHIAWKVPYPADRAYHPVKCEADALLGKKALNFSGLGNFPNYGSGGVDDEGSSAHSHRTLKSNRTTHRTALHDRSTAGRSVAHSQRPSGQPRASPRVARAHNHTHNHTYGTRARAHARTAKHTHTAHEILRNAPILQK